MAYRIKLKRSGTLRKSLSLRPVKVERDLADIGYYRPASSIARSGLGKRAAGKPNHHRTGSKHATGSPSKVSPNIKFTQTLPKYVHGTYAGR